MTDRNEGLAVRLIQTSKGGDRLSAKGPLVLTDVPKKDLPEISADTDGKGLQEIYGIGGAFTEAGGYVLSLLTPEKRNEVLRAYFDPKDGLGYTLCRTHVNSCDFALGNYSSDDIAGDQELRHFNIDRDRKYLIPFIRDAQKISGNSFKLLASPWSPPAWMKTNGEMNHGGKLKPDCGDAWALFYAKYVKAYRKENIDIWAMTVQNEPEATQRWDSCIYTAEEERDFVKNHLGPVMKKEGLSDVRIIIYDHNRDHIYDRAKTVYSDSDANRYVWGIGFHWYVSQEYANVDRVFREFPDKRIIFTEGCIEGGPKPGQWDRGEIYAKSMINDFNSGASGWIDWNMVLDMEGGPNHAKNFCDAPVFADTKTGKILYQSSFYYLGHFSKFVRPGARRLPCRSGGAAIEACAFRNPDSTLVFVVLNGTDDDVEYQIRVGARYTAVRIPAHAIQTLLAGPNEK